MNVQHAGGVLVEVNKAVLATGGLRTTERQFGVGSTAIGAPPAPVFVHLQDLLTDGEAAAFEVDVRPAQPEGLSASQPAHRTTSRTGASGSSATKSRNAPSSPGSQGRTFGRLTLGRSKSAAGL